MNGVDALILCLDRIANVLERLADYRPDRSELDNDQPKAAEQPFPWDDPRVSARARRIRLKTFGEMASIGRWHVINDTWQLGELSMGGVDAIMAEHGYTDWMKS